MAHRLACLCLLLVAACGTDPASVEGARLVIGGAGHDVDGFRVVDFGEVAIGTKVRRNLALRNDGMARARLELSAILPPYSASWTTKTIEPGDEVHLPLAFAPVAPGVREALVRLEMGDDVFEFLLQGTGTSDRTDCLEVEPAVLDFGTVDQGCPAATHSITIGNRCPYPVEVGAGMGQGDPAFGLAQTPGLPAVVEAGGAVVIDVGFAPQRPGSFEGRVVVVTEGQRSSVSLRGRSESPGRRETTDRFGAWATSVDVLLVIDEGAATAVHGEVRRALADYLEELARWGEYDLRIAATGSTLEPGPGCGGSGGQLLPAGAPEVLEEVSWHPDGLADRVEALLSPPACEAPARPLEAALRAAEVFARDPSSWLSILIVSAREDTGEVEVPDLVSQFVQSPWGIPSFAAVAGPAQACGQEEAGERLAAFAHEMLGTFSPICEPWEDSLLHTLPHHLLGPIPSGFSFPRTYYLSDRPADRNGDGRVDEQDVSVFVEGVEVPPDLDDRSAAWRLYPDNPEIAFNPVMQPRKIEEVHVEYEVVAEPKCDER